MEVFTDPTSSTLFSIKLNFEEAVILNQLADNSDTTTNAFLETIISQFLDPCPNPNPTSNPDNED